MLCRIIMPVHSTTTPSLTWDARQGCSFCWHHHYPSLAPNTRCRGCFLGQHTTTTPSLARNARRRGFPPINHLHPLPRLKCETEGDFLCHTPSLPLPCSSWEMEGFPPLHSRFPLFQCNYPLVNHQFAARRRDMPSPLVSPPVSTPAGGTIPSSPCSSPIWHREEGYLPLCFPPFSPHSLFHCCSAHAY